MDRNRSMANGSSAPGHSIANGSGPGCSFANGNGPGPADDMIMQASHWWLMV